MMMHEGANRVRSVQRTVGYLAHDRKKTVAALALVAVMAVMWSRVLLGRKPEAADASSSPGQVTDHEDHGAGVRFQELPIIPGRNDRINRDFFAVEDWKRFRKSSHVVIAGSDAQTPVVSSDRTREAVARVAERLNLEAVLLTKNPQVFVNNQLMNVGDTLSVEEGAETYDFEIVRIEADSVLVRCRERQLTLQVAQSNDVKK
jgi:hypothetical protein